MSFQVPPPGWASGDFSLAALLPVQDLLFRWTAPGRIHHAASHLSALLDDLRRLQAFFEDPGAAEIAVWYHDAVWSAAAPKGCEEASAALMEADLRGEVSEDRLRAAESYVLATQDPFAPSLSGSTAVFVGMDLAVLGSEPSAYARYASAIASEYTPWFGPEAYARGRSEFLRRALDSPKIFASAPHSVLEASARENIGRELPSLEATS